MQIPIQFTVSEKTITGILHIPQNCAKGLPVMIMCYGLNGCRSDVHRMSVLAGREAEKKGIIFLRIDYRGQGVSEGNFYETTIKSKIEDIIAAINFIKGSLNMEPCHIVLIGFSDGARIATQVAEKYKDISALAMWSPVLLPTKAGIEFPSRLVREPLSKEIVFAFYGLWLGKEHLREMQQQMSIDSFYNFKGPKLCLFGDSDDITYEVRNVIINGNHSDIETVIIPGAGHVFERAEWIKSVIDETTKWVLKISGDTQS